MTEHPRRRAGSAPSAQIVWPHGIVDAALRESVAAPFDMTLVGVTTKGAVRSFEIVPNEVDADEKTDSSRRHTTIDAVQVAFRKAHGTGPTDVSYQILTPRDMVARPQAHGRRASLSRPLKNHL